MNIGRRDAINRAPANGSEDYDGGTTQSLRRSAVPIIRAGAATAGGGESATLDIAGAVESACRREWT